MHEVGGPRRCWAEQRKQRKAEEAGEAPGRRWRSRGGPGWGHRVRSLRLTSPPPARSLTAPYLAAPGDEVAADGANDALERLGPLSQAASPSPCLALRYPPGSTGLAGFPRAAPRPAGLAARAGAGSLKGRRARTALLSSALAGKGPAPRAGRELLKRHTRLPAPGSREREPGGLSTLGSREGLDASSAGVQPARLLPAARGAQ